MLELPQNVRAPAFNAGTLLFVYLARYMNSKLVGFVLGAALLVGATPAFAATIPATTVFDGQTQAWGNAGQSIHATFRVNVAAGEVVHAIRTKVDSQATVCVQVGPYEGAQDVDVPVDVILPPNSNTSGYNLTAELFTTATLPQAEAMTGNLACTGTNTNAYNGTNVLHVLPVSGSNTTTGGTTSAWQSALDAMNAAWNAKFDKLMEKLFPTSGNPAPTPVPAKPACPPNGSTPMVQTWLMSNGYGAGFFAVGMTAQTPTNNWGSITASAYAQALAACK